MCRRTASAFRASAPECPIAGGRKHGAPLRISASIGVARNQHSDQAMQEIQQQADQAMYQAKRAGRNRVTCFAA